MKYSLMIQERQFDRSLVKFEGSIEISMPKEIVSATDKEQSERFAQILFDIERAINSGTIYRCHINEL